MFIGLAVAIDEWYSVVRLHFFYPAYYLTLKTIFRTKLKAMEKTHEIDNQSFTFRYSFESGTGELEAGRYLNDYQIEIWADDQEGQKAELVGKGELFTLLLGAALNNDYNCLTIFDWTNDLMDLGNAIFDFEQGGLREEFERSFHYDLFHPDICFINRLEILPAYRGKGLGKKIIKDIYHRFESACGLIVLKAFPIQFEGEDGPYPIPEKSEWRQALRLDLLEPDEEKATYKLYAWYQSLGFENIFHDDFFFCNTARKNEKLEAISFD